MYRRDVGNLMSAREKPAVLTTDEPASPEHEQAGASRRLWLIVAAFVAGLAIASVLLIWWMQPDTPGDSSAEAGFARDMSIHHTQAVEMALAIRDRTQDEILRVIATDIMLTQQAQIGRIQGWLDLWDLRATGVDPAMAWMGEPTEGLMPGMATPQQIADLSTLPVADAEVQFLQLMIAHHTGGIAMAEAIIARSDQEDVVRLASAIAAGQQIEIDAMTEMLTARGESVSPMPGH